MLERQKNESVMAHHRRLVEGKLVDKSLSDIDYTELSLYLYGQGYSSDVARRMMYGSLKTLQAMDADKAEAVKYGEDKELDAKMVELTKERQKFYDQRSAYNRVLRERARAEEINDIITRVVKTSGLPELPPPTTRVNHKSGCDLLVSLNDIHYGMEVDNYWGKYNSEICADMMRKYLTEIFSIANTHNAENCIVWANGDFISGAIHDQIRAANRENVIEQVMGVSELIAEFLAELSANFTEVRFVSVSGNHSRIGDKDKALLGERLDDLIEWYLKARLEKFSNIVVGYGEKIDTTMYAIDVRGKTYIGVHGDFDRSPNKAHILQAMAERSVYAVLTGHLHYNSHDYENGIRIFMAGSFLGIDDYCISRRLYSKPEQMVCVCDDTGVRCIYDVPLR